MRSDTESGDGVVRSLDPNPVGDTYTPPHLVSKQLTSEEKPLWRVSGSLGLILIFLVPKVPTRRGGWWGYLRLSFLRVRPVSSVYSITHILGRSCPHPESCVLPGEDPTGLGDRRSSRTEGSGYLSTEF